MAQLKDTTVDGVLNVNKDIEFAHKMAINGTASDGTSRENFQPCNQSNNCVVGYGNYTADDGNTHIYGVAVKAITKDNDVQVDGIQIAHTDTSTITSLSSGWNYHGSSTGNYPTVRRYGKVVSLTGSLTNTSAVTLNSTHIKVFTIPSGYRPSQDIIVLCQGSSANEFCIQVKPDGGVYFGRYGTSSFSSVASGAWFPFHVTWIME